MQQHLAGTEVAVLKNGKLYTKSHLLAAKRARLVNLRGIVLNIRESDNGSDPRVINLENAKLFTQESSLRIVIQLTSKEKVTLYAGNETDFASWVSAFTDSIQWKIQRFYDLGRDLGQGAFATVKVGVHKSSGEKVAVKIINKISCTDEDLKYLQREIDIARSLQHENIVQTREFFESENHLYIVLEYMAGGTLQGVIERLGRMSEDEARLIMKDLLTGLEYLHGDGVVHRDIKYLFYVPIQCMYVLMGIKPENILCSSKSPPLKVKLIDFGLARHTGLVSGDGEYEDGLGPGGLMTTPVGTPSYVAPEVLMSLPYGKEIDLFACGVVMYLLLSDTLPFDHEDPQQLMELIKRTEFEFPDQNWRNISAEAKDLISGLLDRSPYARLSVQQALSHRWMGP